MSEHPFLESKFHPAWSRLSPEHVKADIQLAIERSQKNIEAITAIDAADANFENTIVALEQATRSLNDANGLISHLLSVADSPPLRAAHTEILPLVSNFYTEIYLNEKLWQGIKAAQASPEAQKLEPVEQRLLSETVADFVQQGADLNPEKKQRFKQLNAELAQLHKTFNEHVLDASNAFELIVKDASKLAGLPESARQAAAEAALAKGHGSKEKPQWLFTLQQPSITPVMIYAQDAELRHAIWSASSKLGREEPYRNQNIIVEILRRRQEQAELLGYPHYSDWALERRMAKSGARALELIETTHQRIVKKAHAECSELEAFRAEALGLEAPERLEPWESAYWSERRRKALFDFDEELLRNYFPLQGAIDGFFKLAEKLFGVRVRKRSTVYIDAESGKREMHELPDGGEPVEVWASGVHFCDLMDADGSTLGSFYMDFHPRANKRSGAWMGSLPSAWNPKGNSEPHLGLISCNFTPPSADKPPLLSHRELETLFHELGHLMHHLLGKVAFPSLDGTNVAWDFVELPSQIMENWCWERASLDLFAAHYASGEKIPEDIFQKMCKVRNYMQACFKLRQLSIGKLDLELHMRHANTLEVDDMDASVERILKDYLLPLKTRPPWMICSLSHVFGSSAYASAYYSYLWSEMLDADAFGRFKSEGLLNADVGRAFRECVLEKGNSRDAEELFRDFMGRDPNPEAFLERSGLA